jgi:hypothetical protein
MEISNDQIEAIAERVSSKLQRGKSDRAVTNEEHNAHHLFIKQFIEEVALDKQAKRKIVESGKIWCFILFLGLTGAAIWSYILQQIKMGMNP